MKKDDSTAPGGMTLTELCALTGVSPRTARYYIQIGLLDRPDGETRAARYHARHLEQLVRIRQWSVAGLSLERIRELLCDPAPEPVARAPRPGTVSVCSHVYLAPGLTLVIDPAQAGLEPQLLRQLVEGVMSVHRHLVPGNPPSDANDNPGETP